MSENLPTTLQCNDNDSNYLECAKHLLLIISERINNKTKEIENLKNTIYTGGADIAKVGNIMGSGALPPSTNSVKKALESINGDFVGSFKETSKAIWELHNIQSEVLKLFKIFILCLGQITSNINRDKQSHKKAVDRLNQVTSRIEQGEINVSELIDIFAENVKEEVEEYQLLEEKITNLSNNQADFIALIKERGLQRLIAETYRKCKTAPTAANHVRTIYEAFSVDEINRKIVEMLCPEGMQAPIELVYQSIEGLHEACPRHPGDWYFTGHYPTPGGIRLCNEAFVNYVEKVLKLQL